MRRVGGRESQWERKCAPFPPLSPPSFLPVTIASALQVEGLGLNSRLAKSATQGEQLWLSGLHRTSHRQGLFVYSKDNSALSAN